MNSSTAIARRNRKSELLSKRKRRLDESDDWWIKGGLISATSAAGLGGVTAVTSLLSLGWAVTAVSSLAIFSALFILVFGIAGALKFFFTD